MRFRDKVILITGAGSGIGLATARRMADEGGIVYAGIQDDAQRSAVEGFEPVILDVTEEAGWARALAGLEARHGGLDVLVNNAGITRDGMFHKMEPDQWRAVITTNLDSIFNMTRNVIDGMRGRSFGRIINISSVNGQKGQMGQSNYSAAKAGLIGFTKALAQESAFKGITVNAVAPGYIGTEMVRAVPEDVLKSKILPLIPVGRLGEPEEVARCVVFLASEEAGFITGSTISANGGQYMV